MKNVTLNNLMKKYGKPVLVVLIFAILGALVMGIDAKKKKSTTYTASRQIVISHNIPQEMRTMSSGANIVNATAKAMKEELPQLQPGSGKVTLLQKATVNNTDSKTTPSTKKYVVVGFALGALLGLIIEFVVFTVKNFGHKE